MELLGLGFGFDGGFCEGFGCPWVGIPYVHDGKGSGKEQSKQTEVQNHVAQAFWKVYSPLKLDK